MPHYLGAWTDQRFILLVPSCDNSCREEVLKELKTVAGTCGITWRGDRIVPKIQIRMIPAESYESPEALLSGLDPTWNNLNPLPGVN